MKFLLPTGIGDSVWALHKIGAIRDVQDAGGPIDVALVGGTSQLDSRALDFIRRFTFVNSATMKPYNIYRDGSWFTKQGFYNYLDDGWYEFEGTKYCILIPNATLERGERLETWLPQYAIRWNIFDDFRITDDERSFATQLHARIGDYAVFYPGPLAGNTEDGHNRNALWPPENWVELGRRIHAELGLRIVVVGALYDASYWQWLLGPLLADDMPHWYNLIGQTNLGQLWSVTSRAKFLISYQAGVGIVATYLNTPTAVWWRPYGDSISQSGFLSFDERMASAWVPPKVLDSGTHLPLIYGRHGVGYIMDAIRDRGWAGTPMPTAVTGA
jgi:hypothetical protein